MSDKISRINFDKIGLFIISLLLPVSLIVSKKFVEPTITPKLFYFYFSTGLLITFFLAALLFNKKNKKIIYFNRIDIILILFILYQLTIILFTKNISVYDNNFIIFVSLTITYYLIKLTVFYNKTKKYSNFILYIFIALAIISSVWGLLQYADILPSYHHEFKLTGPFGNPGPYANYLVSLLPLILAIVIFNKEHFFLLRIVAFITILLVISVLIITKTRTGWIAAFAGVIIVCSYNLQVKSLYKTLTSNIFKKGVFVLLILILLAISGYYLFRFKADSAKGRLFIWHLCIDMIKDKPVFGHGYNSYNITHNNYQANYFRNYPDDTKRVMISDNLEFAFNEYLQMTVESGIILLCIFLLVLFFAFRLTASYSDSPGSLLIGAKASLGAILVTALFSYPLHNIAVQLNFFLFLGIISGYSSQKQITINPKRLFVRQSSLLLIIIIVIFEFHQMKRFSAQKKWKEAAVFAQAGKLEQAMKMYKRLYPILRYDHFFLFNYGAELSVIGEYDKSISILNETMKTLNDADVYTYLGNSYEGAGNLKSAEICFKQAMFLIPFRFYPRYRLVKLYEKSGKIQKALVMADKILNMPAKVNSHLVRHIREEMESFIKTYKYN